MHMVADDNKGKAVNMRKYIGEKATDVAAVILFLFMKLYMKVRHPITWREHIHNLYIKMREAEERKAAKKRIRFMTKCTYGNDSYNDHLRNIQLLRHFSSGGMLIRSNNGVYCVVDKNTSQKLEVTENVS